MYLLEGAGVYDVRLSGPWVAPTTTPAATKMSVAWGGSGYEICNNFGSMGTFRSRRSRQRTEEKLDELSQSDIRSLALLLPSVTLAQQADPAFLQRAVSALQSQRNEALNAAAAQQARADGLADDLAKAQGRDQGVGAKPEAPPK